MPFVRREMCVRQVMTHIAQHVHPSLQRLPARRVREAAVRGMVSGHRPVVRSHHRILSPATERIP